MRVKYCPAVINTVLNIDVGRGLINQGGSESDADYVYTGNEDDCKFDVKKVQVKLSDCRSYNLTSQEKLKQLLYSNGPISIGNLLTLSILCVLLFTTGTLSSL